jgi:hypothetical protein
MRSVKEQSVGAFIGRFFVIFCFMWAIFLVQGFVASWIDVPKTTLYEDWDAWTVFVTGALILLWLAGAMCLFAMLRKELSGIFTGAAMGLLLPTVLIGAISGSGATCVSASEVGGLGFMAVGLLYFLIGATGMFLFQALINFSLWSFWTLRNDWEEKHPKK